MAKDEAAKARERKETQRMGDMVVVETLARGFLRAKTGAPVWLYLSRPHSTALEPSNGSLQKSNCTLSDAGQSSRENSSHV